MASWCAFDQDPGIQIYLPISMNGRDPHTGAEKKQDAVAIDMNSFDKK